MRRDDDDDSRTDVRRDDDDDEGARSDTRRDDDDDDGDSRTDTRYDDDDDSKTDMRDDDDDDDCKTDMRHDDDDDDEDSRSDTRRDDDDDDSRTGSGEISKGRRARHSLVAISLHACYAMPGTDISNGAIYLRPCSVLTWHMMLPAYALATRSPVLTWRVWCYQA
eukprot:582537-Rhodomonas_salina.4